jgi:hypothetical protein
VIVVDATLLAESHRLLDQARMIAEAPAAQTAEIVRKRSRRRPPQGQASSPTGGISTLEQCGWRINAAIAADSDSQLRSANRWASKEIDALQHGSKEVGEAPSAFSRRIGHDYEGVEDKKVASAERKEIREIRDARTADGRSTRYGYRTPSKGPGGGG